MAAFIAALSGTALEWYDFVVYGFLTVVISPLFFPAGSEYASLLLTMATFGVGFVFANAVRFWGEVNPDFFRGTAVEKQAAEVLANGGSHVR